MLSEFVYVENESKGIVFTFINLMYTISALLNY